MDAETRSQPDSDPARQRQRDQALRVARLTHTGIVTVGDYSYPNSWVAPGREVVIVDSEPASAATR
jgi:hypothetical protein